MKIGIIGLGAMGSRVANNIIQDGHETYLYNRSPEKAKELKANVCSTPKELVEKSDVIFSFVSNDEASENIWNHPETGGALSITADKVILESSTLSEAKSKQLINQFQEYNFLLSPVVGSRPQAQERQLVFLIGGKTQAFEQVNDIIDSLAAKAIHFETSIQACQLKLTINSLFGIQAAAFAEFYNGLHNAGFSEEKINAILPNLPITAPIMQMMLGLFAQKQFEPLFPINLVEKDFRYAVEFLNKNSVESIITNATQKTYKKAIDKGLGEQNISGIFNLFYKGE